MWSAGIQAKSLTDLLLMESHLLNSVNCVYLISQKQEQDKRVID